MNYIFFLTIIPLFFIIPSAFAEPTLYENYELEELGENPDGTKSFKWTQTVGTTRILDGDTYQDFIFTDNPDNLQVETMFASVRLDKNTCEFSYYNEGIIGGRSPLFVDDIIPYQTVTGQDNWNLIPTLDSAACTATWDGVELKATKTVPALGTVEYVYMFQNYKWKTELRATNDSGLNNREFGFEQVFNLNSDTIRYGGAQRNLDNFDGQTFDRTWLENNEGKVINLLNGYNFDFDLGFEKLDSVSITDTGADSSQLVFAYFFNQTVVPDGTTLIIDPTFSDSDATDLRLSDQNCNGSVDSTAATLFAGHEAASSWCYRSWVEWDISAIPDTATIDDTLFKFDVFQVWGGGVQCDIYAMDFQPSTRTDAQNWADIRDGTEYVDKTTECQTAGNNKSVDLGATADSDLETLLTGGDYFAIGLSKETVTASQILTRIEQDGAGGTPEPTLEVEYSTTGNAWSPGPPINPSTTDLLNAINFTWTPDNATDVTGYAVWNSSTNSTNDWEWDWLANTANFTGSTGFYHDNGSLWACKEMYYKVSAFSANNGTNSSTAKGTAFGLPNAVEDLTVTDTTFTGADLDWGPPNLRCGTLSGYQINYTTPYGSPETLITNDTKTATTESTVSGLSVATQYSFRVSPWTQAGNNASGNIANTTTLGGAVAFGNVTLNQTNPNTVQMLFERQDINDTHSFVNVTYSNTFDLNCQLSYELALVDKNYTNLDSVALNTAFNETSFLFVNQTDDIVTIYCWDTITNYDGSYILQWSGFPLLDQFNAFRDGDYGTDGYIGALDLLTVLIIIGSMIGFNRFNESVGVIVSVAIMGFAAFLQLIEWPTVLTGIIAIIVIVTVTSTRKD